jgi:hypothetical protein
MIQKKLSMHASRTMPAPIVKGNSFGNFQCSRNQYEINQMNTVQYASAVGSFMSAQASTYPNVVHVSGMFWQKSSWKSLVWFWLIDKT